MAKFNIGDKVRIGNVTHVPARYRNTEGVVSDHRYCGERITVKFPDGGEHWFYENELTPAASAKSLLREKYSKSVRYASGRSGDEQAAYFRAKNKYVGRGAIVGGKNGQIIEVIVERDGEITFDVELDGGEVLHSLPLNRLEIY